MRVLSSALFGGALILSGCTSEALPENAVAAEPTICGALTFDAAPFLVCEAARTADIRLHLNNADGAPIGGFDSLREVLGQSPAMITNAGMYHADRRAVGLYIEDGVELAALQTRPGPGNFGLIPNGVFWSNGARVSVTETLAFAAQRDGEDAPTVAFATQSGPMLLIDGNIHPRFLPDSESRKRRNGVGVSEDKVFFAISDAPVTFHHFARLFRDELKTDNALFLDGTISRISAPELGREERGGPLGPMVALMRPESN